MPRRRNLIRTSAEIAVLLAIFIGVVNYQSLLDDYALATFKPSDGMQAIAGRLDLTRQAKAVFYRSKAQIDEKAAFNSDCDPSQGTLELGCYYQSRIYILQIDNSSLAPEMDVVAAHELLHSEWARYSKSEQASLTTQLEQVYASLNDPDLKARMASYAQSEPGQEGNELHSILGTETASLPPALEQHYAQYFADRAVIVAAHAQYQSVFDSRRQELADELATIRQLKGQLTLINSQMAADRSAGQIDQYNALVPRQNQLVDTINSRIDTYQAGVDEYNELSRTLDSQQITDTESGVQ